MRVEGFRRNKNKWNAFRFHTTYRMSWELCKSMVIGMYDYIGNPEICTAEVAGAHAAPCDIKETSDILQIPEAGVLIIRGANKVYDNAPFQFYFYNQTDTIDFDVPDSYTKGLKKSETEYLNDEELKHVFDKFMDSIEVMGHISEERRECFTMFKAALKEVEKPDVDETYVLKRGIFAVTL